MTSSSLSRFSRLLVVELPGFCHALRPELSARVLVARTRARGAWRLGPLEGVKGSCSPVGEASEDFCQHRRGCYFQKVGIVYTIQFLNSRRCVVAEASAKAVRLGVVTWACRWIAGGPPPPLGSCPPIGCTSCLFLSTPKPRHTKTAGHGTFRLPCRFLTLIRDSHSAGSTRFPPFGTCRVVSNSFS